MSIETRAARGRMPKLSAVQLIQAEGTPEAPKPAVASEQIRSHETSVEQQLQRVRDQEREFLAFYASFSD